MKYSKLFIYLLVFMVIISKAFSLEGVVNTGLNTSAILDLEKYNRAIHIMVMLILGFGFLMVFVRKYGRSALTATYLLVSASIPLYLFIYNYVYGSGIEIDKLIFAEFAAASILITAGAVLGRLKMYQYLILALLFIPSYMANEWIMLNGGLNLIPKGLFIDTGGSIVIHAFGAIFGLAVAISMTSKQELDIPVESDFSSDRFSMLGSMALWVFWPSFCAALVPAELIPHTIVNVILALCGSTLATYVITVLLRKKISIADIANAALAGGVAIGSTCDHANHIPALIIGLVAGIISTVGFAKIQTGMQKAFKLVDTCGVSNLHGLPGLFGGLAAIFIVQGINAGHQLTGIGLTILIAVICGLITGKFIHLFGRISIPYNDSAEFVDAE